jgi:predicted permease
VDLGFEPDGLAAFRLELGSRGYDPARSEQFYDRVLERAASLPGVQATTVALGLPLSEGMISRTVLVEGRDPKASNNAVLTPVNVVEPGYFRTLGTPLARGRDLSPQDVRDGLPVAVINRAAAASLWEGEEALGRRFSLFGTEPVWEVVGVVGDSKLAEVGEEPQPQIFLSRRQVPQPDLWVVVRAGGDPEATLATLQGEFRLLDSTLPVTGAGTFGQRVRDSLGRARAGTFLLGLLGALTLVLSAVGVYGVTAYSVQQRKREIGIRVAVGASRGDVIRAVLGDGMKLLLFGLAAGMVLALPGARLLQGLLYGLSPGDPATYAVTALLLAAVALTANLVPALRASGLDPVKVLRSER